MLNWLKNNSAALTSAKDGVQASRGAIKLVEELSDIAVYVTRQIYSMATYTKKTMSEYVAYYYMPQHEYEIYHEDEIDYDNGEVLENPIIITDNGGTVIENSTTGELHI